MQLYAITITYRGGKTRDIAQEGTSATDAIALVSLWEYTHRLPDNPEVLSVALANF